MNLSSRFSAWMRSAAPAPFDETEEYRRFTAKLVIISTIVMFAAAYIFSFFAIAEGASVGFAENFSILSNRLQFLRMNDHDSYVSFSATLLSSSILVPIVLAVWVLGYWKTVAAQKKCRPASIDTFFALIFYILFGSFMIFIAYIFVPANFDPRWPGNARIIFWPIFPAINFMGVWSFLIVIFSLIVSVYKFTVLRGGYLGGS